MYTVYKNNIAREQQTTTNEQQTIKKGNSLMLYYVIKLPGRSHVASLPTFPFFFPFFSTTDHIMKDTSKTNKHRQLQGYEVCIHTCGCNPVRGRPSPLWHREGGSCVRHSLRQQNHPNCSVSCPGHSAQEPNSTRESRTRLPTRQEIIEYLSYDEAVLELARLGLPLLQEETHAGGSSEYV